MSQRLYCQRTFLESDSVVIWQSKDQAIYLFIALAIKAQTKVSISYFFAPRLSPNRLVYLCY